MTRQLIFVHGRAQERKDARAMKDEWIDAWRKGLAKSGLEVPIPDSQIRFPYYGDTLDQLTRGVDPRDVAEVIVMGQSADAEEKAFVLAYLREVQRSAGISDAQVRRLNGAPTIEQGVQDWHWVHPLLSALDANVPGASGTSVALFTNDVYRYLTSPGIRDVMDVGVRRALAPGRQSVVVSHSLGTVVAYNVLRRDGETAGFEVPLFVTLGSPLAVNVIRQALAPIRHPRCAERWFNAFDPRDIVALYPLDVAHFDIDPSIENKTDVDNNTPNRHGIAGYLDDKDVARRIFDALMAP
jgi:hypothetical protein